MNLFHSRRSITTVAFATAVLLTATAHALDLYVSVNGNDAWTGRHTQFSSGFDGPLATLTGARNIARKLKALGPARIIVGDGQYQLTQPLVLEPEDSGISFEAAPGARPLFSGGREIRAGHPMQMAFGLRKSLKFARGAGTLNNSG